MKKAQKIARAKTGPKNPKGYDKHLPVMVTQEIKNAVEEEARIADISAGEVVRRAINEYLAARKNDRKPQE